MSDHITPEALRALADAAGPAWNAARTPVTMLRAAADRIEAMETVLRETLDVRDELAESVRAQMGAVALLRAERDATREDWQRSEGSMSEARDRLIEEAARTRWDAPIAMDDDTPLWATLPQDLRASVLDGMDQLVDAFLARPDDLLAVLVEEGAVEVHGYWSPDFRTIHTQFHRVVPPDETPRHRRTEGRTR